MKRRITAIIVAIALVISGFAAYNFWGGDQSVVYAAQFRDGYSIEPLDIDYTGVNTESDFIFKWENEEDKVSLEDLENQLTVSPQVSFSITKAQDGFLIHFNEILEKNTIYIFNYNGITFPYKTEADFNVVGTFPRNQTTNVPTNTGIEITFNYEGADLEDYFDISPKVKGSFETHGRVTVFVPKALEEATVYTVTLKAGLPLKGSDKALSEDRVFSFETGMEDAEVQENAYINFMSLIDEYSTAETPTIFWDYYSEKATNQEAKVSVYAYDQVDSFIDQLNDYATMPFWSWYGMKNMTFETKGLNKVMDFNYDMSNNDQYPLGLTLPESLEQGFYLVDVEWQGVSAQTFIQVTDLSFYYSQDAKGDLFWIHDLANGQAVKGASVSEYVFKADKVGLDKSIDELGKSPNVESIISNGENKATIVYTDKSNADGILRLSAEHQAFDTKFYRLSYGNQDSVLLAMNTNFWDRGYGGGSSDYWKYFKSDRSLYKPDDTVEFFGYVKDRYSDTSIDQVKVEIGQGGYYWDFLPYSSESLTYMAKDIKVDHGFFTGKLKLPGLAEGGYELKVSINGELVATTYITVEEYLKPSYKIESSFDRQYIFVDQPINIKMKSQFFEGTPVSYLDFDYNISGVDYMDGRETTDKKGEYTIKYTPKYMTGYQGMQYYNFSAYAQLPETGNIWNNQSFYVFFNDINVDIQGQVKDGKGRLTADVHAINLDRVNALKDSSNYKLDILGQPLEGQVLKGTIIRNEWIKTEAGEYYDYINKEVRKRYNYDLKKTDFKVVNLITDDQGHGTLDVDLPEEENVHYTAEFSTQDTKGRPMDFQVYIGKEYEPYMNEYVHVELDQDDYHIGDTVKASVLGDIEDKSLMLYGIYQNGLLDYKVSDDRNFSFVFKESYLPNVDVDNVRFNGKTYLASGSATAKFNIEDKRIYLDMEADQEAYRPGEEATFNIFAYYLDDQGGKLPVTDGMVNLGLIDEALLSLSDQAINPLEDIYQFVSNGIFTSYYSHSGAGNSGILYGRASGVDSATEEMAAMDMDTNSMEKSLTMTTSDGASLAVRSEFKDTAYFATVKLDQEGRGSVHVTLPDNVTSWRLTGAAISESLQAGSQVASVNVSLPFFLNTSISSTYLVGDKPMIGVTAYGSDLLGNEAIDYVVDVYDMKDKLISSTRTSGQVFERSNLSLGQLNKAGTYKVLIKGLLSDGSGDAVEHTISIVDSYHESVLTNYYDVQAGLELVHGVDGNATLTFTDQGRAYYLPALQQLAFASGKRLDQAYLADVVKEYLNEHFETQYTGEDHNLNDYIGPDGGLAILPYADADIETSVNMIKLIKDRTNTLNLAMYLKNAWYSKDITEKGAILYGLTILDEQVLYDMNYYRQLDNLSIEDLLYLSMAYAEIGDTYMAKDLLNKALDGHVEAYDLEAFVNVGDDNKNYKLTSLAMDASLKAGDDIHTKFYTYVNSHYNKDYLPSALIFDYISQAMDQLETVPGSISYTYNGKEAVLDLGGGYASSLTLPNQTLKDFHILDVKGDVRLALSYMGPLEEKVENDPSLKVTRTYYNYQTGQESKNFKEGDLVKVVLNWEVKDAAVDDFYKLSDYAPAGLKPIDNPWQLGISHEGAYSWYRDVDGQKVDFYIYKDTKNHDYRPLVYYARISSIGQYKAEAPIIQGVRIQDSLYIDKADTINISE